MPVIHIEMKMRFPSLGVEARNIFYMEDPVAGPDQATGTIAAIRAAYAQHLAPILPSKWEMYGATWRNVSVQGMGGVDVTFELLKGGAPAADLLPPTVAALVSFRTGTPPPKSGRKYLTGFGETSQTDGRWLPSVVTALQAWGDAIVNIGSGAGSDRPLGVARIDPSTGVATAFNPYALAIARDIVATMRSRRIGQGI